MPHTGRYLTTPRGFGLETQGPALAALEEAYARAGRARRQQSEDEAARRKADLDERLSLEAINAPERAAGRKMATFQAETPLRAGIRRETQGEEAVTAAHERALRATPTTAISHQNIQSVSDIGPREARTKEFEATERARSTGLGALDDASVVPFKGEPTIFRIDKTPEVEVEEMLSSERLTPAQAIAYIISGRYVVDPVAQRPAILAALRAKQVVQ